MPPRRSRSSTRTGRASCTGYAASWRCGAGAVWTPPSSIITRRFELARRQGARALELRAALSRARALRGSGREAEAVQALSTLIDWFPAEDDSADLRNARRLLREASG